MISQVKNERQVVKEKINKGDIYDLIKEMMSMREN